MKKLILAALVLGFVFNSYSQQTGIFTDPRDGKVYKTVQIGNQTWFAENLAYKPSSGKYWAYQGDPTKFGYFYNWETAKNICPSGWHLPSKGEYEELLGQLGGEGTSAYRSLIPEGNSGFNALLAGDCDANGIFDVGESALFWSSSPTINGSVWYMVLSSEGNYAIIASFADIEQKGYSVRCIKDN